MSGKIRNARVEESGKLMEIMEDGKAGLKSSGIAVKERF